MNNRTKGIVTFENKLSLSKHHMNNWSQADDK